MLSRKFSDSLLIDIYCQLSTLNFYASSGLFGFLSFSCRYENTDIYLVVINLLALYQWKKVLILRRQNFP